MIFKCEFKLQKTKTKLEKIKIGFKLSNRYQYSYNLQVAPINVIYNICMTHVY